MSFTDLDHIEKLFRDNPELKNMLKDMSPLLKKERQDDTIDRKKYDRGLPPYTDPLAHLRRTGRTTRMLNYAKKLAAEGRAVYIIADNTSDARRMEIELGDGDHGIKAETPETLSNFDLVTCRLLGAHPNCVILVDHHVIEDRFRPILEMLHAFDRPHNQKENE